MTILITGLISMLLLVLASGAFSAAETAFFTLSREELRRLQVGKGRDQKIWELMKRPDRLLTGILFYNLLVNLSYFAVSVFLTKHLINSGQAFYAGLVSLIGLIAAILLGEVLPKSLAVLFRLPLARLFSRPLSLVISTLDPIMPFLQRFAKGLRYGLWPDIEPEPVLAAADLEQAVEVSHQSKEVAQHEREVLHNILDLSELTAEEVMRPRGSYLALKAPISLKDLVGLSPPAGYVMVSEPEGDHLQGVISLGPASLNYPDHLERTKEKIIHVPWCAKLYEVLERMRKKFVSVASVVNEYGETIGVVIYEDLIDTILEEAPSRAKRILEREPIRQLKDGEYAVEGMTAMRDMAEVMDVEYDEEDLHSVTVIGFLQDELERFPEIGDVVRWHHVKMVVHKTTMRGQAVVHVSKIPVADEQENPNNSSGSFLGFKEKQS